MVKGVETAAAVQHDDGSARPYIAGRPAELGTDPSPGGDEIMARAVRLCEVRKRARTGEWREHERNGADSERPPRTPPGHETRG